MPTQAVAEMEVLREFANTVLGKAKHQAPGFEPLVLTLTGAVAAYHDPGTARAGQREDHHHLSSCWFDLKGVTYFLSYEGGIALIRHGGKQGPVDFECTEAATAQDVFDWFESKAPLPIVR